MMTMIMQTTPVSAENNQSYSLGSRGNAVLEINKRLKELRYLKKGNSKQYNEATQEAVRHFQQLNGLPETGTADPETLSLLLSDRAAPAPWPTLVPLSTPEPPPVPELPEVSEDGYLEGDGEYFYENDKEGQWIYLSSKLQIYIHKYRDASVPLEWFET